jgi:hypothetical protein
MVYSASGSGGRICRDATPGTCLPVVAGLSTLGVAYYNDTTRTNANGTFSGRTAANKFRLLESSHVRAEGPIVVEAGDVRIEPVDSPLSVQVRQDGSVEIKVDSRLGLKGVLVTTRSGQQRQVGPGEQLVVPR